jgi:hypothetical protein
LVHKTLRGITKNGQILEEMADISGKTLKKA